MAKILKRKKVYGFEKECRDEFGTYIFYFNVFICFSKDGITWQIQMPNVTVNEKKLRNCLNIALKEMEEDNPRYFRLKDEIFSRKLCNKLW